MSKKTRGGGKMGRGEKWKIPAEFKKIWEKRAGRRGIWCGSRSVEKKDQALVGGRRGIRRMRGVGERKGGTGGIGGLWVR
jgi:hypothetical protein